MAIDKAILNKLLPTRRSFTHSNVFFIIIITFFFGAVY